MEISLEDVVLNNLRLGVLVNFEPEGNEAFDAENTKVYGKEKHNNPLELFPNESEEEDNGFTTPKIKLINKENEIEVGIGEFPNNPLKLCTSENEEEENVHELITVEKSSRSREVRFLNSRNLSPFFLP